MAQSPIRRAIVATDGSEHAEAAVSLAGALAWHPLTTISVASVVEVPPPSGELIERLGASGFPDWRQVYETGDFLPREQALTYTASAADSLRERHPAATIDEVVCLGEPATELLRLSRAMAAELIVAGARGRTAMQALLLGSVGDALVSEAPCPVLIVHSRPADLATVLVAVASVADADRLATACLRLPLPPEARLVAVTATAPLPITRPGGQQPFAAGRLEALLEEWAESEQATATAAGSRFVERIRAEAPDRAVEARIIRGELNPSLVEGRADVAPALLAEAHALGAAMVVIGAREHHGRLARLGLGSVSRKVARRAPTSVLVVREPMGAAAPPGSSSP